MAKHMASKTCSTCKANMKHENENDIHCASCRQLAGNLIMAQDREREKLKTAEGRDES